MFKTKKRYDLVLVLALIIGLVSGLFPASIAYAEDANISFGSDDYTVEDEEEFLIGVYLNSEVPIGRYTVELEYDHNRLEYVEGIAHEEEPGKLILTGSNPILNGHYLLRFSPISGGEGYIRVVSGELYLRSNARETFDITSFGEAPIFLPGEDTVAEEEEQLRIEEEERQAELLEGQTVPEDEDAEIIIENPEESKDKDFEKLLYNPVFDIVVAAIVLIALINIIFFSVTRKRRKKRKSSKGSKAGRKHYSREKERIPMVLPPMIMGDLYEPPGERPVIIAKKVTMEFEIAVDSPSGLKDYAIRFLKRQIRYRTLYALCQVSFNIYKGDVVGIIGTNGSGKSTLLKIISGALKPTRGIVKVDRSKLQILTLGTGFDMELTAKENVYLNGAIIGYSKEFIDTHYDEIVDFAELHDFMEEKVKNFSSGMVSRLGFAIATVGKAAEILILDEVLSVGDEFFRKKSLARIKEMIHGGSTVLLVSHNMDTILKNCNKCLWIEKGELCMMGTPKLVCQAYRVVGENR